MTGVWRGIGLLYAAGVAVGLAVASMARAVTILWTGTVVSPVLLGILTVAAWWLTITAALIAAAIKGGS